MNFDGKVDSVNIQGAPEGATGAPAPNRMTADAGEGFAVLLIGMRINKWWRPDLWIPIARAMGRMLRELHRNKDLGLLGVVTGGLSNPIVLVQYWKSHEHLQAFATGKDRTHLPAWTDYNKRVRATNAVGVWHETYVVPRGCHESVYVNMPPFGLGAAFGVRPATGRHATAMGRLRPPSEPPSESAAV